MEETQCIFCGSGMTSLNHLSNAINLYCVKCGAHKYAREISSIFDIEKKYTAPKWFSAKAWEHYVNTPDLDFEDA